jgi:penicillin-binding protein 1A
VARLPTRFRLFRALWTADSYVSSALFEVWAFFKRAASAYSSFIYKWFAVRGLRRAVFGVIDDSVTFGTVFAFGLLAYALPPFSGTGDVWNRGREYAVTFTDESGALIGRRGIRQDDAIPLDDIPPHVIKAVLATEDVRFFDHFGVDVIGTLRAVVRNARSDKVQGGSSITQQVAKNLFLSPERTIQRKIHEAFLSMWIEARRTKEEILKLYLDRSYMGGGTYGVEAAAQFYFGKSIRDVSLQEAAILAGLFKAPTSYAPHRNPEAALGRSSVVLYRMLDAGYISQGELIQARRNPPRIVAAKDSTSPDWYLDYAYEDTLDVLEEQGLQKEFVIEVKTPVDRKLQAESQAIINDVLNTEGSLGNFSQGASVTMATDGAMKAIIGGRDYETSQFNRATQAERQSGSSFKPYVYLAALLQGHTPSDVMVDGPVSIGGWSPGNYKDKYSGSVTLQTALAKSLNSIPVKLMLEMGGRAGVKKISDVTHLVGVQGELDTYVTMVLGTSALTLMDLSTGYATFAAGGKLAKPYAVLEIRRPNGDLLYERAKAVPPARQVVAEETIADLNMMLGAVVTAGTGRSASLGYVPQGGKTGTNQSYRDAWYVGFTKHFVTGVWVGNDDFMPMNDITGGRIPAPIWKRIMEVAEAGKPAEALAGLPITEEHMKFAAELEKTKAETQVASVTPDTTQPVIFVPGVSDESPAATPDIVPQQQTSTDVLTGMFNAFEPKTNVVRPKRVGKSKVRNKRVAQDDYNIPRANARSSDNRNFLDRIFGGDEEPTKRKKKKKKLFLDF